MSWLSFIVEYLKKPRLVGAVSPSSPALVEAMLKPIHWASAKTIVEFGPGTGVMTKEILKRMRPDAILTAYELNETFANQLTALGDKRLTIKRESAELMSETPDAVISSLPLLSMPKDVAEQILANTKQKTKGFYVQFQYTQHLESVIANHFTFSKSWVAKNIPPAHVYACLAKRK